MSRKVDQGVMWWPLTLALCVTQPTAAENTEVQYVAKYGYWVTNKEVDSFFDEEVAWFAFVEVGRHGSIRVSCDEDGLRLMALADTSFLHSLGSALNTDPIKVKIKVDDNPIVETDGSYPFTLVEPGDPKLPGLLAQMEEGREVRVRTDHGSERHTLKGDLAGFRTALAWVKDACQSKEVE